MADTAWRTTAFHALRLPLYWTRLCRAGRRVGPGGSPRRSRRWCFDDDGRQVRRSVALGTDVGASEAQAFHRITEQHRERVRLRLVLVAAAGGLWRSPAGRC